MVNADQRLIQTGSATPPPRRQRLRAGRLTMWLEQGALRYVQLGELELVRGIYVAVRDQDWGTVPPTFLAYDVEAATDAFRVRWLAEHVAGDVDFAWEGVIEGRADSTLAFTMQGAVRRPFLKNRIGFCVLHPIHLAGAWVSVRTGDGWRDGVFPATISPHQPFPPFTGMRHAAADGELELALDGDEFELEDQRNWTDASFKTYCTPLAAPYPVLVQAGQRIDQSIALHWRGAGAADTEHVDPAGPVVRIFNEIAGTLPQLGVEWTPAATPPVLLRRLRALGLSHVWAELRLTSEDWPDELRRLGDFAAATGTAIRLSLLVDVDAAAAQLDPLMQRLRDWALPVRALAVYAPDAVTTDAALLQAARTARDRCGLTVPIGGGSRAYFAQFNRAQLPVADLAFAEYPINPQVHAFDLASIVETLAAQPDTVRTARAVIGQLPLHVGPVTLRPRVNPDVRMTPGDAHAMLAACRPDPRQPSLFAAGWTVGSIERLGAAGVAALTVYQAAGPCGVAQADGERVYPVYHALADIAPYAGQPLLCASVSQPLAVAALAVQAEGWARVLICSFADEPQVVTVELPWDCDSGRLCTLDAANAADACVRPESFRAQVGQPVTLVSATSADGTRVRRLTLPLAPYALSRLDLALN